MRYLKCRVSILATIVTMVPLGKVFAHSGGFVHGIAELSDSDIAKLNLADGSVDDWVEVIGEPTLTSADFMTADRFSGYDPFDFDFQLWLGWNDSTNRLYVAMLQADDVYLNEFDRDTPGYNLMSSHDSSISVAIDGDHSGGEYFYPKVAFSTEDEYLSANNSQAQGYFVLGDVRDGGSHINLWDNVIGSGYTDWFQFPPFADGGGKPIGSDPAISVTEFYVTPFDRFVWNDQGNSEISELSAGKIVGLSISLADRDNAVNEIESLFELPGEVERTGRGADGFADFILLRKGEIRPDVTVIEADSWGRVKQIFRLR